MITTDDKRSGEAGLIRVLEDELGFHMIRVPTTLPTLKVNVYFSEHPVPTLIDVPPDSPGVVAELNARLGEFGYSLVDIKTIVVTHSHLDHCGSARTIVELSGAEVWATEGVATWLVDYERESLKEEEFIVSSLRIAAVPDDLIGEARERFEVMRGFTRATPVARRLNAGETLALGRSSLKVVHVPGHTARCVMFYEQARASAFTGDFLLGKISPNPLKQRPGTVPEGYRSMKVYAASLERMAATRMKAAFPGHGEMIGNPAGRATDLLTQMAERRETVLKSLAGRPSRTIYEVVERLFPELPPGQLFLAVSEVWSHCEVLLDEGLVEEERLLPVRLFRLSARGYVLQP
jgi:glyoxylase-like metal-dependent hydrolase (beta-lactamase superfamily II)